MDLAHSEPADRPAPIKRLGQGEGMRVGSAGLLSRIVSVERRPGDDEWATGPSSDQDAVIRSVRDNIRGLGSSKYYQIVRRGLDDDAPAYVDRTHQWNGLDQGGLPAFLRGADYIMTFNEDKWMKDLSITVEVARAATLYVFYDTRLGDAPLAPRSIHRHRRLIGLDEGPWAGGPPQTVGRGPGTSIDTVFSVWRCDLGPGESIDLGNARREGEWRRQCDVRDRRGPPPLRGERDPSAASPSLSTSDCTIPFRLTRRSSRGPFPLHVFPKGEMRCAVAVSR